MAANLHRAGVLSCVYNRSVQRSETFVKTYAVDVAQSIDSLAVVCDVIIICVSRDQDVLEVMAQIEAGIKPGTVVVDTSTVSHMTAKQVSKQLAIHHAHFLDAPVSGGVEGARNGTLAGEFAPGFKLGLHHKDLEICQAMVAGHGVKLPMIEMSLILYQSLIDKGFADEDISALFRHKQNMFLKSRH